MNCIFNYNEKHEITSVIIPKTVDNIDFLIQNPNDKFNKLKKIIVDKENPNYTSINGILYDKNKTNLYKCPPDINLENIKIPYSINEIKEFAFSGCNKIKSLKINNDRTEGILCATFDFSKFKDCLSLEILIISNAFIQIKNIHYLKNLQTIQISVNQNIFRILRQIISDFNKVELKQRLIIDLPENLFIEVIDKIDHDFMIHKIEHDLLIQYKKYHIISSEANRDLDIELIKNISGKTSELKSDLSSKDLSEETSENKSKLILDSSEVKSELIQDLSKDSSKKTSEVKSELIQDSSKDSSKETSEVKSELIQNSSKETSKDSFKEISKDSSELKPELIQMKVQLNTNCFQILFYIFFGIILTYIFG